MIEKIICAGFGGQGIMVLGKLLVYAGMNQNFKVTWMPSYGAEVRGGTAHSMVVISDKEIASPRVVNPSMAIIMNKPSYDKFKNKMSGKGIMFIDSSLVKVSEDIKGIEQFKIPATEIASDLGDIRVANMVMAGVLASKSGLFKLDEIIDCLNYVIPKHRRNLIPLNKKAIKKGYNLVQSSKLEDQS